MQTLPLHPYLAFSWSSQACACTGKWGQLSRNEALNANLPFCFSFFSAAPPPPPPFLSNPGAAQYPGKPFRTLTTFLHQTSPSPCFLSACSVCVSLSFSIRLLLFHISISICLPVAFSAAHFSQIPSAVIAADWFIFTCLSML